MDRIIDIMEIEASLANPRTKPLPPIDKWQPTKIVDSHMQIDAQGRWFHQGGEIKRVALSRLFASILRKEQDDYFLVTPSEKFSIVVEDVPFVMNTVLECSVNNRHTLSFVNGLGEATILNSEHPLEMRCYKGVEVPYIKVREHLYARLSRSCFYHLVDLAQPDEKQALWLYSQDYQFCLAAIE